ncbi:GntR family transcriptional regulator [Gemmatimonas sp.]|uniref:GntR family transcriptional regulator n=1 Tax=Gemmatimonas sp. TaxID=1962908 RepID=UPI0035673431
MKDRIMSRGGLDAIGAAHRPLNAVVCDELRMWIISGRLAPGSRLVEVALAEELGVSRGPVREAIRQLNREGFVELTPRRGASVASVAASEALECYEVRIALEGVAASLAATRRSDADLDELEGVLDDGERLLVVGRWDALAQMNNNFHEALARASYNTELLVLMGQYSKRIAWIFSRSAEQRGTAAWAEHAAIVAAIRDGDSARAEELARTHIDASRRQFLLSVTKEDALDK